MEIAHLLGRFGALWPHLGYLVSIGTLEPFHLIGYWRGVEEFAKVGVVADARVVALWEFRHLEEVRLLLQQPSPRCGIASARHREYH
jgi:hypothetical protein